MQSHIQESVKLAHRKRDMELCIFTDASDAHWAGVVTQCDKVKLSKLPMEQKYQPLAFLGSAFDKTQRSRSTVEKDAFAILQTFKNTDYLLLKESNTHVFTDHRNLLFVFNPEVLQPALGRHIVSKVQRWALYLQYRDLIV